MGDKHVVPDFLMRAKQGIYSLYGGEDTRSFLFAGDAADATIALALAPAGVGEIFHVGGKRELSMIELASIMMEQLGIDAKLDVHPSPAGSVPRRCPDVAKAEAVIGSFEKVSLEDGLRMTAAFYLRD
jgi:nucleoside-diphosphate-sugar epimerase